MNAYQYIDNAVNCIEDACAELDARNISSHEVRTALLDATSGKKPYDYDMDTFINTVNKIPQNEQTEDVISDILGYANNAKKYQTRALNERKRIAAMIGNIMDEGIKLEIVDEMLKNGVTIDNN